MDDKILKDLAGGFNVETRQGPGGRRFKYVAARDIIDRMNTVFQGNWSSEVKFHEIDSSGNAIVLVRVYVNGDDGKVYYHEGFGGSRSEGLEAGNGYKSAYSKALKDACKKWGVALFLDEEGDEHSSGGSVPPAGYMGHETAPVKNPPSAAAEPVKLEVPTPPPAEVPPVAPVTPAPPKATPPSTPAAPVVPGGPPMAPPAEPAKVDVSTPTPPSIPTMDTPLTSAAPKADMVNEVQKVAIAGIMQMKQVTYDELSKLTFEYHSWDTSSIPSRDDLTYDQAIALIKYGNNVLKK